MTNGKFNVDIVRNTLAVLFIALMITASFYVLRPFFTALIWATMIVVTTWPLLLAIQTRFLKKRGLTVIVMSIALLLILIIPLTLSVLVIIDRSDEIVTLAGKLKNFSLGAPPDWLERIPVVGAKLTARWQELAKSSQVELSERVAPYAKQAAKWLVSLAGDMGMMILQFLLTVIISAILYSNGESAGKGVCLFARRLGGHHGEDAAILAGKAIRGVALGVVVTALAQAFLAGIGLFAAGVPAVVLLTAVIFVLCVAQVGPMLVLIPVIIWLFYTGQTVWGGAMIVWALFVGTIDSVIRPFLIKKGADLPILLIFAGVIGGLIAFGVIGLFIGPVMLAVTYTLLQAWVLREEEAADEARKEEESQEVLP